MKIIRLTWIAALAVAALPSSPALAQGTEAAASAASAASAPRPVRRIPSPAEQREDATAPDLRPDMAVTPQLVIPLGRKPEPVQLARPGAHASAASASTIDDGAARCEAQAGVAARAACRDALVRARKPR